MSALERVMLVEDDRSVRRVAQMALEMVGGLKVRACESGVEALDAIAEFRPQLVLLDVMMPGMDGPAVLRRLREQPETARIPVVFLTAKAQDEQVGQLRALGVLGVIFKPFDPMTLAKTVASMWDGDPSRTQADVGR
jgi:two-component system OmpR family response regulator